MDEQEVDEILGEAVQAKLPLCQANWPDDVKGIDGSPVEPLPSVSLIDEGKPTTIVSVEVPIGFTLGIVWQRLTAEIRAQALAGTEKLLEILFLKKVKETQKMSDDLSDLLYGEDRPN